MEHWDDIDKYKFEVNLLNKQVSKLEKRIENLKEAVDNALAEWYNLGPNIKLPKDYEILNKALERDKELEK